ncbi:MAG: hypothetical protein U5J95_12800 [Balneolaceae bacterium]|nr:hypothetical protein [Balneolaceae bacterium]
MNTEVYFSEYDTSATVHVFFDKIYSPSVLVYIEQFTIGLPVQIIELFKEEQEDRPLPQKIDREVVLSLSEKADGNGEKRCVSDYLFQWMKKRAY